MPPGHRPERRPLTRADLPDTITPDTLRQLDLYTIRRLSQRGNGILGADEQHTFDQALRNVMQDSTDRLGQFLRSARRDKPETSDPQLRRSFARTQQRLEAQARRALQVLPPQLTEEWDDATLADPETPDLEAPTAEAADEGISLAALESEIEQTSDTLEILERIASIEQQQLEHHRSQLLRDVRGAFLAVVVSIAVIVAGVAPLVEADSDDRRLIAIWTLVVLAAAGVSYAIVRAAQNKRSSDSD